MFQPNFEFFNYAMDHRDWPGKQWLAEHQACRCTRLQRFSQTVKPFWRLLLSIFCFLNESFLFQNSTLLCRQNRIFFDMSYFLKIDVLSPIFVDKALVGDSTSPLVAYKCICNSLSEWPGKINPKFKSIQASQFYQRIISYANFCQGINMSSFVIKHMFKITSLHTFFFSNPATVRLLQLYISLDLIDIQA